MKPRRVRYAGSFTKSLTNLSPDIQRLVVDAVDAFIMRSRENALRPERKSGLSGIWAFRVTSGIRVFYVQERDTQGIYSLLFHVGPHDDYRTVSRRRPQ